MLGVDGEGGPPGDGARGVGVATAEGLAAMVQVWLQMPEGRAELRQLRWEAQEMLLACLRNWPLVFHHASPRQWVIVCGHNGVPTRLDGVITWGAELPAWQPAIAAWQQTCNCARGGVAVSLRLCGMCGGSMSPVGATTSSLVCPWYGLVAARACSKCGVGVHYREGCRR